MSGAVSFHLFTPLGIDPNNDGGGLFAMAVVVWLSSIAILIAGRGVLIELGRAIASILLPPGAITTLQGLDADPCTVLTLAAAACRPSASPLRPVFFFNPGYGNLIP